MKNNKKRKRNTENDVKVNDRENKSVKTENAGKDGAAAADANAPDTKAPDVEAERATDENANTAGQTENVKEDTKEGLKGIKRRRLREWGEILYNCPYLIAVVITSAIVMICPGQTGFGAIRSEARSAIETSVIGGALKGRAPFEQVQKTGDGHENDQENIAGIDDDKTENEGECKGESGENGQKNNEIKDNMNDNNDNAVNGDVAEENPINAENTGNSKGAIPEDAETEPIKGVTRFKIYAPQKIDSYYYSDAGKIALTTEYPYKKENISYFNDAAFLGDSRTLGISDYAGLDEADFYCDSGMTIFKILDPEGVTYQKTGRKVDLSSVLKEKRYGKIYIMLGMNELGYGNTDMYREQYRKVVEQIREWQPGAIIYIMANLHVSKEKNNAETEFNNININDKNAASALLANGTDIFYLDANPLFTDAEGCLNSELTFDGVHLYAKHYEVWKQFLMEHAVEATPDGQSAETGNGTGATD